jgi:hypothetical protein
MTTQIVGYMDNRHFPETQPRDSAPTEHRCSQCFTPGFGKSSIRCRNEPGAIRAAAFLAKREQMNQEGVA